MHTDDPGDTLLGRMEAMNVLMTAPGDHASADEA
jgi:hypothetical protein